MLCWVLFSWKAKAFSTTLGTALFFFPISVFTAVKTQTIVSAATVLAGLHSYQSSRLYSHFPQTFTTVIYHFSVFFSMHAPLSHSGRVLPPLPQLVAPLFSLISTPCSACCLLFLQMLGFPLFFLPSGLLHSCLPTASRISTENHWLYIKTINFMLLLCI